MFEAEIANAEAQVKAAADKFLGGVISGAASANGIVVNNTQSIPISASTTKGGLPGPSSMVLIVGALLVGGYFLLSKKSGRV
jgi:hypothetical protein